MHEHKALLTRFQTFYCCYLTACCVQTSSISSTLELSRIAVPCSLAAGQLNSNLPTWAGKFESIEKDWTTWMWGDGGKEGRGSVLKQWPSGPPTLPYLQYSCYLHSKCHTASDHKADGNGHWEWADTNSDFVESNATNLESQFHRLLAVIKELFNLFEAWISHL